MRFAPPRCVRQVGAVALLALVAGLSQAGGAGGAGPTELPADLRATGLYAEGDQIAEDVWTFSPQYPLWTDGARKRRWIRLPAGSSIDASDPDAWSFPIGTQLWKEFSFGRRVETRYMLRVADGWRFGTYLWDEAGTTATLAPRGALVDVGGGQRHEVPAAPDCAICHDASPVLGFSALQLSPDRDPHAPHAEPLPDGALDLSTLLASGRVVGLPRSFATDPPRIAARTPTERAARGYLHGNCGGCHDTEGSLASLQMDLSYAIAQPDEALLTIVDQPSLAPLPTDPEAPRVRVAPGDPDGSVLLGRMRSRAPAHQMPPLGTRLADDEAVALVARWIAELDREASPEKKSRRTRP